MPGPILALVFCRFKQGFLSDGQPPPIFVEGMARSEIILCNKVLALGSLFLCLGTLVWSNAKQGDITKISTLVL